VGGAIDASVTLDLTQEQDAWRAHRFYPETAYAIGRLLSDPALPLADLRGFLSDVGRKLAQA
jgi:type VI secretion system protein ImpM